MLTNLDDIEDGGVVSANLSTDVVVVVIVCITAYS